MNKSEKKELISKYEDMRLLKRFGTPEQRKKAIADVKHFVKEHPDIADEVFFKAKTGY